MSICFLPQRGAGGKDAGLITAEARLGKEEPLLFWRGECSLPGQGSNRHRETFIYKFIEITNYLEKDRLFFSTKLEMILIKTDFSVPSVVNILSFVFEEATQYSPAICRRTPLRISTRWFSVRRLKSHKGTALPRFWDRPLRKPTGSPGPG